MTRKDHYFLSNPDSTKIYDGVTAYPARPYGEILCAKEAGYTDICYANGFFDCRECWLMRLDADEMRF